MIAARGISPMGLKRFIYVLLGSVLLSNTLFNISDEVREWGLVGVIYFTAFSVCIAVTKPASGGEKLYLEGGSAENTYALIFFIVAPFIGSIAWYLTAGVTYWILENRLIWSG
jgi:hypothetical protein